MSIKLNEIEGIGPKTLQSLKDLNIHSFIELISHFPRRYEDRKKKSYIEDVVDNMDSYHLLKIKVLKTFILNKGKHQILKVYVTDEKEKYKAVLTIFQYSKDTYIKIFKKDVYAYIYAKFTYRYNELQSSQFELICHFSSSEEENDLVENNSHLFGIIPIYHLNRFFSQKKFRTIIRKALGYLEDLSLPDILPKKLMESYSFLSRKLLIQRIHFPESLGELKKAQYQIKYYEFFKFLLLVRYRRIMLEKEYTAFKKNYIWDDRKKEKYYNSIFKNCGFFLNKEQEEILKFMEKDLLKTAPMYRLLQGEVGSGKTIIAVLLACIAISNGFQVAFMAPTESLAKQHYRNIKKYFKDLDISSKLLIASLKNKEKKDIANEIKKGEIQLIIGTHILFSDWIEYHNLAFVIIDEQHKFGVQQRLQLINKNKGVDLLAMSATPIPRTLALHLYGDLDVSNIYHKAVAQAPIESFCCFTDQERNKAYEKLYHEIKKGRQGFIICPMIEESEKMDLNSVFSLEKEIRQNKLPTVRLGVYHGKLNDEEKNQIMHSFLNKEIDILISTSILEVGIDVHNANCILIEDAHRFGLAQLHQLRGRVGRGIYDSYCFFITQGNIITEDGQKRLKALLEYDSGFKLSEVDLEIRGAGELLGHQQSGLKQFKLANLIKDKDILIKCQNDINEIIKEDPLLEKDENKNLKKLYLQLEKYYELHLTN